MYVLGIETSCDETAVAIVRNGHRVVSHQLSSSLQLHRKYGGVIPEIASRMQLETISALSDAALRQAGLKRKNIGLVSVTSNPGLLGSLLVGVSFAKSLSLCLDIPLVGTNHVYSHLYANFLNSKGVKFPFVGLVVSGGHTSLFYLTDFDCPKIIGQTQDDACGEAFDKVAKMLGLGYPGGPLVERLSKKGNPKKIRFNCSDTRNPLDFSFSGIKTAVLYYLKKQKTEGRRQKAEEEIADVAAAFQEAVIDTLIRKSLLACEKEKVKRLVIGGGVAVNQRLRQSLVQAAKLRAVECFFPVQEFCLDNAAMVAGLGYQLYRRGHKSDLYLSPDLN